MAKRKCNARLMRNRDRVSAICRMVGLDSWKALRPPIFGIWVRRETPTRPMEERTYAAYLFVRDLELAISIAERTTGIREAGREAKAVAALKEIAGN